MSDVAIKIENLSKQYRLGLVSTGTLSHDLNRWWHLVRGKEDPYLKVSETNDRAHKGGSEYVWALKDINLEVRQGEVLGIIGKNGAGKSTLLKILSKVTAPTTGTIKYKGRIGSLLEVGTGFHQELTGRENIFLNGAILGMTRSEVQSKLDEIIDFSGVERYIDTPVKRYSSGMTVRLGFAVAAFLEPDILVVDEVLAVGDAEFHKKAIGKMQEVGSSRGRTVLFVSHNLNSIQQLCLRAILVDNGQLVMQGGTSQAVEKYVRMSEMSTPKRMGTGQVYFEVYSIEPGMIHLGDEIAVKFRLCFRERVNRVDISLDIRNENLEFIAHVSNHDDRFSTEYLDGGRNCVAVEVRVEKINLAPGVYYLSLWAGDSFGEWFDYIENCLKFKVTQGGRMISRDTSYDSRAKVVLRSRWGTDVA